MSKTTWDSKLYQNKHSYVYEYGSDLLNLLKIKPEERILDLGCGTGQLSHAIQQAGAQVTGVDASASMINDAKENFPEVDFHVANAEDFYQDKEPFKKGSFDAAFSNAALHWMKNPVPVIRNVYELLKNKSRFVFEMGSKHNVEIIVNNLCQALITLKLKTSEEVQKMNPWYFPSLGEYTSLLEKQGFHVELAQHFSRPTKLDGEAGLRNWILMYAGSFLEDLNNEQLEEVLSMAEKLSKDSLYKDDHWEADYYRLRVVAVKV